MDPKYHPKIIGRQGAVIKKLRTDHQDVNIQMPNRDAEEADKIVITGYEASANAAKASIQKIVDDLVRVTAHCPLHYHDRLSLIFTSRFVSLSYRSR